MKQSFWNKMDNSFTLPKISFFCSLFFTKTCKTKEKSRNCFFHLPTIQSNIINHSLFLSSSSDLSIFLRLIFTIIISLDMIAESLMPVKCDLIMSVIEINDAMNFLWLNFCFQTNMIHQIAVNMKRKTTIHNKTPTILT